MKTSRPWVRVGPSSAGCGGLLRSSLIPTRAPVEASHFYCTAKQNANWIWNAANSPLSSVSSPHELLAPPAASVAHGNDFYPVWFVFPVVGVPVLRRVPEPNKDLKTHIKNTLHCISSIIPHSITSNHMTSESRVRLITFPFPASLLWKKRTCVNQKQIATAQVGVMFCTCCFRLWAVVCVQSIFGRVKRRECRLQGPRRLLDQFMSWTPTLQKPTEQTWITMRGCYEVQPDYRSQCWHYTLKVLDLKGRFSSKWKWFYHPYVIPNLQGTDEDIWYFVVLLKPPL